MASSGQPIIRIVRKKGHGGGHHGGSWKVAYADFVTAMMAFFLVMWILGLDQPSKSMISDYFNDPVKFTKAYKKDPIGFMKLYKGGTNPNGKGTEAHGPQDTAVSKLLSTIAKQKMEQTKAEIRQAIDSNPDFKSLKSSVEIVITDEGLKIELLESRNSLFFESGSATVEPKAARLLGIVAKKIGVMPNPIAIEGHTDRVPYSGRSQYSNWELSTDRANAARRILESSGLHPRQVAEVRGYADKKLRLPDQPTHFSNRRVSILVPYVRDDDDGASPASDPFAKTEANFKAKEEKEEKAASEKPEAGH